MLNEQFSIFNLLDEDPDVVGIMDDSSSFEPYYSKGTENNNKFESFSPINSTPLDLELTPPLMSLIEISFASLLRGQSNIPAGKDFEGRHLAITCTYLLNIIIIRV